MIQRTLIFIKPDGVQRQLTGRIIQKFEDVGLKIVGTKMIWADADFSKKHYQEHIDKPFYKGLEQFLLEGPVIAFVLEGIEAISLVRKMVGSTEPKSSAPGTIRGDFSHVSYNYADKNNKSIKNIIHASANEEDAKREIALWFSMNEIFEYKTVHEVHTQ